MTRLQVRRDSIAAVRVLTLAALVLALSLSVLAACALPASAAQADLTLGPSPKTSLSMLPSTSPSVSPSISPSSSPSSTGTPTSSATAMLTSTPPPTLSPVATTTPATSTLPTRPAAPSVQQCASDPAPSASYIQFCAPVYDASGDAKGPNGTRVTVVGASVNNTPPDALYFFRADQSDPADATLKSCVATGSNHPSSDCFQVASQNTNQSGLTSTKQTYLWTFTLTVPATVTDNGNRYVVAAGYPGSASPAKSSNVFQVESEASPCVIVTASGNAGDAQCPAQAPVIVAPGKDSTVTVQGANWLPQGSLGVEVIACVPQSCGSDKPVGFVLKSKDESVDDIQPDDNGNFSFTADVSLAPTGTYAIQAWSIIDGTPESLAAGALSFTSPDKATQAALVLGEPTADLQDTSACSAKVCAVPFGSTFTVTGNYWPTTPRVYLTAPSSHCGSTFKRNPPHLPDVQASLSAIGTISAQLSVKGLKADAKYQICANDVPVPHLIQIGPPTPTPATFASPLAWIAVALALASLGLYFLRPRGRAFAVGQGYPRW